MKKAVLFVILILLSSCVSPQSQQVPKFNEQQESFNRFLTSCERRFIPTNDIQRKEYSEQFSKLLFSYIDSVGLFYNWKGNIHDMDSKDLTNYGFPGYTLIEFTISYEFNDYDEVSFYYSRAIKNSNLHEDSLYNVIKAIPESSPVFFDGFVKMKDGKVPYTRDSYFNSFSTYDITHPYFEFMAVDIRRTDKADTLSNNLRNAIDSSRDIFKSLQDSRNGKAAQKKLMSENEELESRLTTEEKEYLNLVKWALLRGFLRD